MCDFIELVEKACQEGAFKPLMTVEEDATKLDRTMVNKAKRDGLEEGQAIGKTLGQAEIIQSLLDSGMTIEEVSKITKISIEDINKLLDSKK